MFLRYLQLLMACFAVAVLWSPQPASALAHPCPGGPGANEVQVGESGGGGGVAPVPMCAPRQGGGAASTPAPVSYYYIYGSIAWHPDVDDVWMVGNSDEPRIAEREALAACQRAMGGGCASIGEWHNSSMAIVRDRSGTLWNAWDGNGGTARKQLLADCSSKQPVPCEVVGRYSSGKRSYVPNLAMARKKYASAAWVNGDGYNGRIYISGGHDNWQEAENLAIATCAQATGRKCQPMAFAANGVIQTFQVGEGNHSATAETSAKRAKQAAQSVCKTQGQRCTLQVGYDSRTPGLIVHDFIAGKAVG